MDRDEDILLGKSRRRIWIAVLVAVPFVALIGAGLYWYLTSRGAARDEVLVENVTGAAFGCVASIRGDAPEAWGLELALEHMSHMERTTRDADDPATRDERARFDRLAADAARGCEELGRLMMRAQREAPHLYFAVPAALAQPPDQEHPDRWYRRVLPTSRVRVVELTRQIRTMSEAINRLRAERSLMAQELPIDGRGTGELARLVLLPDLPRDRDDITGEAWPLADGVFVLRRGAIARVLCETRYLNRASCFNEFVQRVTWGGDAEEPIPLVRPTSVNFWAAFAAAPDGTLYAVGVDMRDRGVVGRYPPGATVAEIAPIAAPVDGAANIVAVAGGVAIFPADGSAWFMEGDALAFSPTDSTNPPVFVTASQSAEVGMELEGSGRLSLFGSDEAGWTSRLTPAEGEDVLHRVLDAHSGVRRVAQLRALRSGRVVVLVARGEGGPNALLLSQDFGRAWLTASAESPRP